jgi:hypothetical protein
MFVAHNASYGNGLDKLFQAVENRDIAFYAAIFDGLNKFRLIFPHLAMRATNISSVSPTKFDFLTSRLTLNTFTRERRRRRRKLICFFLFSRKFALIRGQNFFGLELHFL